MYVCIYVSMYLCIYAFIYVCILCVILLHPAKAVRWNEMPFGSDTCVSPSNTVLDRGPVPRGKGRFGEWETPVPSNAAYQQISLALVGKLKLLSCYHSFLSSNLNWCKLVRLAYYGWKIQKLAPVLFSSFWHVIISQQVEIVFKKQSNFLFFTFSSFFKI